MTRDAAADGGRLLLTGGQVLDLDVDPHRPRPADILIEGDRIAAVLPRGGEGEHPGAAAGAERLDVSGMLVAPGFVNGHYHSHDVFLKGCFDPDVLELWVLNALPRNYRPRSDRELRLRTLLGAVECIRGGITTIQDMLTLSPLTADQVRIVADAYREAGLRTVIALQAADVPPLDTVPYWPEEIPPDLRPLLSGAPRTGSAPDPLAAMDAAFGDSRDPLVTWGVAPSSPERCSRPLIERLAELAARHDLPVFSHIYISRAEALNARRSFASHAGSLVRYLKDVGLLGPRLCLAHGVWLDDAEIEMLAEAGASLVINPLSNLKTRNGVAPVRPLLQAGVNLAVGCDNCSCSDAQNIFQAMKLFALLAAVSDPADGPPDAVDALRAATGNGAKALGLERTVGAIRPGMMADLTILDLDDPVYVPFNSAARQIVYGEGGRGVRTVIVGGRVVMRDRRIATVDEAALREEINGIAPEFMAEAGEVFRSTERLRPHIARANDRIWSQPIGFSRYVAGQTPR